MVYYSVFDNTEVYIQLPEFDNTEVCNQFLVFDNTEVCMQYLEFDNTEVYPILYLVILWVGGFQDPSWTIQ